VTKTAVAGPVRPSAQGRLFGWYHPASGGTASAWSGRTC